MAPIGNTDLIGLRRLTQRKDITGLMKRLADSRFSASGDWKGKAGGYAIQGLAGVFVLKLVGSYTNVVGLPLYETISLLEGEGFPVRGAWADGE